MRNYATTQHCNPTIHIRLTYLFNSFCEQAALGLSQHSLFYVTITRGSIVGQ